MSNAGEHLSVAVRHNYGASGATGLGIDMAFTLTRPWTVLFGPSGSGKTTILRAVAGLLRPQHARIAMRSAGGETVLTESAMGLHLAAHRRGIAMVSQQSALFPHKNVRGNVEYGMGRGEIASSTMGLAEVLSAFRVEHLAHRMPSTLSGGERQRVALARAVASGPRLLLLDEPFTGMEWGLRRAIVDDLRAWMEKTGTPVLSVTHDVAEVFLAADEVISLESGTAAAQGLPGDVLAEQRAELVRQLQREG